MKKIVTSGSVLILTILLISSSILGFAGSSSENQKYSFYSPLALDSRLTMAEPFSSLEPPVITGPIVGGSLIELNFSAVTPVYDTNTLSYKWDWGDGNITDWIGPINATEPMLTNYSWLENGIYQIHAKVKNSNNIESNWSKPHNITIVFTNPLQEYSYRIYLLPNIRLQSILFLSPLLRFIRRNSVSHHL